MARTRNCRTLFLAAIASTALHGSAQGLEPPLRLSVQSTRSATGSFAFSISGVNAMSCSALAQKVRLDRTQTPLSLSEVAPCSYAVTPSTALAAGNYCLTVDQFTGSFGERCFEVTNVHGDLSKARLVLEDKGPDIWSPASCRPCANPSNGNACTQSSRGRNLIALLKDGPLELASEYAFAVTTGLDGETDRQPMSKDFGLFDASLSQVLMGSQRDDAGPCATLFARRFGSEMLLTVGRACIPPVLPSIVPDTGLADPSLCEPEYWTRWCQDNAKVCSGEGAKAIASCADYALRCTGTKTDDGSGAPAAPANDASSEAATDSDTETDESEVSEADSSDMPRAKKKGGCQIALGKRGSSCGAWLLVACGAFVVQRGARRRALKSARSRDG